MACGIIHWSNHSDLFRLEENILSIMIKTEVQYEDRSKYIL